MSIQLFDRLNLLTLEETPENQRRSEPYETYFGAMPITKKQAEDRMRLIPIFAGAIRQYLLLILMGVGTGIVMWEYAEEKLRDELRAYNIGNEEYRANYAKELTRSTREHLGNPWYFSEDRVRFNAENEANTVMNNSEFLESKERGYTRKQWIGINDSRERPTHRMKNDEIIPIDEYFQVGDALLLYPKDLFSEHSTGFSHPEEIVNCRCGLVYLP